MTTYLQRLVSPGSSPSNVRPFVRSGSPLIERDQRLAVPGFEQLVPAASSAEQVHGDTQTVAPISQARERPGVPDAVTSFPVAPPSPQVAPGPALARTAPKIASATNGAASPAPRIQRKLSGPSIGPSPAPAPAAASAFAATPVVSEPLVLAAGRPGPVTPHPTPQQLAPPPAVPVPDFAPRVASLPTVAPAVLPRTSRPRPEAERTAELLVPTPSPRELEPLTAPTPAASAQVDRRSPTVTIGRISVEVIKAPAASAPAQTSASGPLTANSVSKIGPLGPRISASRLLALRQR